MRKKELYDKVIAYFEQAMPVAETELNYGNPFELLIAVILSAQCTDKRVNIVCEELFEKYEAQREALRERKIREVEEQNRIDLNMMIAQITDEFYPMLTEKYNIVVEHMLKEYGIDLQGIAKGKK